MQKFMLNKLKTIQLKHNKEKQNFVMELDNGQAIVNYSVSNGVFYLNHSEVPRHLRGKGIGKVLVEKTFQYLEENKIEAVAGCSYIRIVAQRNPSWHKFLR